MSYTVNFSDSVSKGSITVEDNTVNQETSISLPGKSTTSYGTVIAENFLHLLENFAKSSAPVRPIEGQLWFDTTVGTNQLKVYDGTNWVASGGLKKALNQPAASESITGDLWVDTDNQQLYLFTGTGWILIGPDYSSGLSTGAKPLTITGTDDVSHTVVQLEVNAKPIAIIATDSFTPKSTITGFSMVFPGFNLSTADITGAGVGKFYGTAEKAENLIVGTTSVAASNFLRADTTNIANFQLKVKNDSGIEVGSSGTFSVGVEGQAGIVEHKTSGSHIDFRVNNQGTTTAIMRLDSSSNVGINNLAPTEALDVIGNIKSSANVLADGTTDATSIGTGSLIVKGGAGVAKSLYVGTDLNVAGGVTAGSIVPTANNTDSLGATNNQYLNVYANNFVGNFTGNVSGTVSGTAGSSNKLSTATTFAMTGDVSATSLSFDGQTGGTTKTFNTTVSNSFIADKTLTTTPQSTDEIIINRTTGSTGVYKISADQFLSFVATPPVGSIMSYGGANAPTGWVLCDGNEISRSTYASLYAVIGTQFGTPSNASLFKVPDLRGRFPLGADNMGGTSAGRVTDMTADNLAGYSGTETKTLISDNLPDHQHDMKSTNNDQFYGIRNITATPSDPAVIVYDGPTGSNTAQAMPNSGGVDGTVGQSFSVMNPYLTINYIIFTGV
jgi:microcystin-dependent protein|tara:strand:+ start:3394 stop:5400 length:2007 start_codon:yes stop_codon:yes gene_type:complete